MTPLWPAFILPSIVVLGIVALIVEGLYHKFMHWRENCRKQSSTVTKPYKRNTCPPIMSTVRWRDK